MRSGRLWRVIPMAVMLGATMLATFGASGQAKGPITVAYVSDVGGLNDKGYNQYSYDGMKRAAAKVHATLRVVESTSPTDYEKNISTMARLANLVVVSGFAMADAVQKVSAQYPNTKFAIIDASFSPPLKNVQGDVFASNQASYLAGIVAANMSKTGTIGFVGGVNVPVLQEFLAGYEAGALSINPKIHIKVGWTGSFTDQQAGKQVALAEIAQHADVVYSAAGASGLGSIAAAKQKHVWAIGVDQDQHAVAPNTVITSVIKHVDVAAADNVLAYAHGKWTAGTRLFNLADGGTGLAPFHNLAKDVPAKVKTELARAKRLIIRHKINVPVKPPYPTGR